MTVDGVCTVVDPESVAVIVSLVGPEIGFEKSRHKGFSEYYNIIFLFQKQLVFLT